MSQRYREERREKNEELTARIISAMPFCVRSFIQYVQDNKSDTTAISYARDLEQFILFLCSNNPECNRIGSEHLDLDVFEQLNIEDINEYSHYLKKSKLSPTTIKRRLSSIASFYKYLGSHMRVNNNPMTKYEYPKPVEHDIVYLTAEQTRQLLSGILSNSMYLVETKEKVRGLEDEVTVLVPKEAPEPVRLKKERGLTRNYAIVMLFLGTGLRISELVGIDVDDLDFENNCVSVSRKGHGESIDHVYFGEEVAAALKAYLYGSFPTPLEVLKKYPDEVIHFCRENAFRSDFEDALIKKFERDDSQFLYDASLIASSERNCGRKGLLYRGVKSRRLVDDGSLFISSRGKRMSVRMVEMIIKEAVLCYLSDMPNKDDISPHKLRSTCATRLLSQTDDIMLVSKQLGHANPNVTAKHYAMLQEKKQREQAASLKVTDW